MAIGKINGIEEGDVFKDRDALRKSGVHKASIAGISGDASQGATSIVLNDGYVDDIDEGDVIIYTGSGGRDERTGRQVEDQKYERHNKNLVISYNNKSPIRVSRGYKLKSDYAPKQGYRYDGLYFIDSYWTDIGQDGYIICRYKLVKASGFLPPYRSKEKSKTSRREVTNYQIVRDSQLALDIKSKYDYSCQVCGVRLDCQGGPYAEAAHIQPLGTGHDGPDIEENLLCLCPNHHALLDGGAFTINDDYSLNGIDGDLRVKRNHKIGFEYLAYHRNLWK